MSGLLNELVEFVVIGGAIVVFCGIIYYAIKDSREKN